MFPCCARIVLGRCTDRGLSREFAWDGGKLEALTRIKSAMSSPPTPLCSVSSACSNPPVAKPSINGCYFAHSFRRRNRPGMAASGRGRSVADRRSSHRERSRPGAPERAADFGASVAAAIHHRAHRPSVLPGTHSSFTNLNGPEPVASVICVLASVLAMR
jgi:hypothetical protein